MQVLVANRGLQNSEMVVSHCAHIVKVVGGIPAILTVIKHFSCMSLTDAILTHSTSIIMTHGIDSIYTRERGSSPA